MEAVSNSHAATIDRVLAVETSGREGSVSLGSRGGAVATATFRSDRGHGAELLPAIARLCDEAGWTAASLDACFVSVGPGSFTGLRIGITLARTLAWCAGVRLVAVPTMEVIAANASDLPEPPAHVAVILDAKRGNVYGALLQRSDGGYACIDGPRETDVVSLLSDAPRPIALIGEGVAAHREAVNAGKVDVLPEALWAPRAEKVLHLGRRLADDGRFTEPAALVPIYIRLPSAVEKLHASRS